MLVVLCLVLVSCDQQKLLAKFTPPAEAAVAKSTLDDLHHGKLDAIESRLAPKLLDDPTTDAKLRGLVKYFPSGEPRSVAALGAFTTIFNGVKHVRLSYEYHYPTAWVQATVVMVEDNGKILIEGLQVNRTPQSLAQTNAFTLQGKAPAAWLMLAAACLLPLFSLFAFGLCLRTPLRGRKWPWAIFTLIGVITVRLNWTNGVFSMQLLSVQLLSASTMQASSGAWVLGVSFPLGAVIFLLRRRALMRDKASSLPPDLPARSEPPPLR